MRQKEHHPRIGIGLFFIVLGLALLAATNDVLHLGSFHEYFTWQTVLIFIGALLLVNLKFAEGIIMISIGSWFLMEHIYSEVPQFVKTLYWPGVVILVGISFIISALIKKNTKEINK